MLNPSLDDIIAQYLTDVESGEHPERERLMANHPQFADALREFFADLDQMNQVVQEKLEGTQDFTAPGIEKSQPVSKTREDEKRLNAKPSSGTKRIGNYKLLQRIGTGGMGEVWMAEQEKPVRRRVALKLIKAGMDTDQVVARFEAERQALAMMDHQNIAKVLDAGTTEDGRPFFVMELVQGISITQYCDQNKLSVSDRLNLFLPVCKAVQHAHQKGIIHRDLKPSNILVTLYDGRPVPKVIDFGLAKALQHQAKLTDKTLFTEFGQVVGTLQYMSPEQAEMNALDIDTRTDVYALGVLLYELLTGSTPIDKETLAKNAVYKVLETIRQQDPPRPSARLSSSGNAIAGISQQRQIDPRKLGEILRGDLDWIVMKALEKDRTRRYETANGFAADVQKYIEGDVVEARPPSTAYRFHKFIRKNKGLVASLITIGALLVIATFISTGFGLIASAARDAAQQSERSAIEERKAAEEARAVAQTEAARAQTAKSEATNAKDSAELALSRSYFHLAQAKWAEGRHFDAYKTLYRIPPEHREIEWNIAHRFFEGSDLTLYGHQSKVFTILCSDDGQFFLTSDSNRIVVWNSRTAQVMQVIEDDNNGELTDVAIDSKGSQILYIMGGMINFWDVESGKIETRLEMESSKPGKPLILKVDSNSRYFAVRFDDDSIGIGDLQTRKWCPPVAQDSVSISALGFCGNSMLLLGQDDGALYELDPTTNTRRFLANLGGRIENITASNLHRNIAADVLQDKGFTNDFVNDSNSPEPNSFQEFRSKFPSFPWTSYKSPIAFSPDGLYFAIELEYPFRQVAVCDVVTGQIQKRLPAMSSELTALSFSADAQFLLGGDNSGVVKLWDLGNYDEVSHAWLTTSTSAVSAISFDETGELLATSSDNGTASITKLSEDNQIWTEFTQTGRFSTHAFVHNSKSLIYATGDPSLELWNYDANVKSKIQLSGNPCVAIASNSEGTLFATSSWSNGYRIFENPRAVEQGMEIASGRGFEVLSFRPDVSEVIAVDRSKSVTCFDATTKTIKWEKLGRFWDARYTSDGKKLIATSLYPGRIHVLNSEDGAEYSGFPDNGPRGVSATRNNKRILSVNDKGSLKIWDFATQEELMNLRIGHETLQVALTADDRWLAFCYPTLRLMPCHSEFSAVYLYGHTGPINSTSVSHNGKLIASSSEDNSVRVWDASNGVLLQSIQIEPQVISLSFDPLDELLLCGCQDGSIRTWEFASQNEPKSTHVHHAPIGYLNVLHEGGRLLAFFEASDEKHIWDLSSETIVKDLQWREDSLQDQHLQLIYQNVGVVSFVDPFGITVVNRKRINSEEQLNWQRRKLRFNTRWHAGQSLKCIEKNNGSTLHQTFFLAHIRCTLTTNKKGGFDPTELRDHLSWLEKLSQSSEEARFCLALAYFRLELFQNAIEALSSWEMVAKDPNESEPFSPQNFAILAMSNLSMGRLDEARKYRELFERSILDESSSINNEKGIFENELNVAFGAP